MTRLRAMALRCFVVVALLCMLHELLVHMLARSDLVPRLLSPHGDGIAAAVALGGSLLVLRLTLLFVVPGAVLTRLLQAWARADTRRA